MSMDLSQIIIDFLNQNLPNYNTLTPNQFSQQLKSPADTTISERGIEKILEDDNYNPEIPIVIPFQNKFYAKVGYNIDENALDLHLDFILENTRFKKTIEKTQVSSQIIKNKLRDALKDDYTFEQFIETLPLQNEDKQHLLNTTKLRYRYYIPRNSADTAKAIYRLSSVGIIRTYTIEYNDKTFTVYLNKNSKEKLFQNFKRLVNRYTSNLEAERLMQACEEDFNNSGGTAISVTLKHLTNFTYNKIADKRKRAMHDMADLCKEAIQIKSPVEQSERIKELIYYYFNAKYAREGNTASNEAQTPADLNADFKNNLPIGQVIWKYIEDIIPSDDNGQSINNIKHLRGASMRMIRATEGAPQFNILKAFSLLFLSTQTNQAKALQKEALQELEIGLTNWQKLDPDGLNFEAFLIRFKKNLAVHTNKLADDLFDELEDKYYLDTHTNWLKAFNQKLKQ